MTPRLLVSLAALFLGASYGNAAEGNSFKGIYRGTFSNGWSPTSLAAANSVGAFAFASGSKDAAVVLNLEPGSYTAQVSGATSATGVAIVEVYELR